MSIRGSSGNIWHAAILIHCLFANVQLEKVIKSKRCRGFHGGWLFFLFVIVLTENREHPTAVCSGASPSGTEPYCVHGSVGNYPLLVLWEAQQPSNPNHARILWRFGLGESCLGQGNNPCHGPCYNFTVQIYFQYLCPWYYSFTSIHVTLHTQFLWAQTRPHIHK